VVSVAANIAEGAARQHMKEYRQHLYIAKASLAELAYYIHLTCRLGWIDEAARGQLDALGSDTRRPLQGLMSWIEQQIAQGAILNRRVSESDAFYATHCELQTAN